jgi:hypothetical protein
MRKLAFLVCFSAMALTPQHGSAAPAISVDEGKRSIVLIQGSSFGTGFSFLQRGGTTYFITAAHLLDIDGYQRNAELSAGPAKKDSSDWLTVYDPVDGAPHQGVIVGTPDFKDDILVVRVQGMRHRPRALCLETALPSTAPVFMATFALTVLQTPPIGRPFERQTESQLSGSNLTALDDNGMRVEFTSFLEKGYSGAPVIDQEAGAALAMVSQSPYSVNSQGLLSVSEDTRYGVGIGEIRTYVERLSQADPQLVDASAQALVETDRTQLDPSLVARGGQLRFVAFDEPLSGNEASGYTMSPVFAEYDRELRKEFAMAFRQVDGSAVIAPGATVYPPNTDIRQIASDGDLCHLPNGQETAGIIGMRRELSPGPGERTLIARIALIDCGGHVIDSANITQVAFDTSKPIRPQVLYFVKQVGATLTTLDGPMGDRLANFAADGLPLSDAEMRGFYRVDQIGNQTYVNYSWANGASADKSKIFTQTAVNSISGVSSTTLRELNGQTLDALLDAAGGSLSAEVVNPVTNAVQEAMLTAGDRCFYLRRRFEKQGSTDIDPRYERNEVL